MRTNTKLPTSRNSHLGRAQVAPGDVFHVFVFERLGQYRVVSLAFDNLLSAFVSLPAGVVVVCYSENRVERHGGCCSIFNYDNHHHDLLIVVAVVITAFISAVSCICSVIRPYIAELYRRCLRKCEQFVKSVCLIDLVMIASSRG